MAIRVLRAGLFGTACAAYFTGVLAAGAAASGPDVQTPQVGKPPVSKPRISKPGVEAHHPIAVSDILPAEAPQSAVEKPAVKKPSASKPRPVARHPIAVSDMQPLDPNKLRSWTPEEKQIGFRTLERIFPGHLAKRGQQVSSLPKAAKPLALSFTHGGEAWDVDRFMKANDIAGLLVLRDGRIVLERYALGFSENQRWASFSLAKSITSTLVGAAVAQEHIKSVDDPVTRYLPALSGTAYDGVTLRQLLTMTSGTEWTPDSTDPKSNAARYLHIARGKESHQTLLGIAGGLSRIHAPGTVFNYNTAETGLLAEAISAATGKRFDRYLSDTLWAPLGMEQDAFVGFRSMEAGADAFAGSAMAASLRDYGRFARFMLEGGRINGRAVLPQGWMKEATTATTASRAKNHRYGYQWWLYDDGRYEAMGAYGQFIHIDPRHNLAIVTLSAWPEVTNASRAAAQQAFHAAVIRAASTPKARKG